MIKVVQGDRQTCQSFVEDLKSRVGQASPEIEQTVRDVIEQVRAGGDSAVKAFSEKFDGWTPENLELSREALEQAVAECDPAFIQSLRKAAENIRAFHQRQKQQSRIDPMPNGIITGQRVRGLHRVGVYVPGGTAGYPSSVLMNVIPAQVAEVGEIVMATPPGRTGRPDPNILAAAVPQVAFNRYPDPAAQELCQAFAGYYGVPVENVAAGNGSDELITVLFTGFLQKGEAFATLEPDFSMYAFNGYLQEARHVPIPKGADYAIDVDRTIQTCRQEGVKLLIFSNPGNPTSIVCPRQEVRRLIQGLPDTLVVLDEAYMDFSDQSLLPEFHDYDNLLLLRTCSKAFGMAGLRLGFAVGQKRLVDAIKGVKSPYNVNALSQKLGAAVLRHPQAMKEALAEILASREELLQGIRALGEAFPGRFALLPCATNFATLRMADGEALYHTLGEQGISIRYTGGLVRITCGTAGENRAVLTKMADYFAAAPAKGE